MDPVELEQLMYELAPSTAEKISIPAESLTPGCVLAEGPWARHVVTAKATPRSADTLQVPVRHLHGGHTVHRPFGRTGKVTVYRARLTKPDGFTVPAVPRCFVPEDPEPGDRVVHQFHTVERLGEGYAYHFDGTQWVHASTESTGNGRSRPVVRTFDTRSLRRFVSDVHESSPHGWYTYLPAGHVAHLYVDGRPVPARTADQLAQHDVMLVPGGGRLVVERASRAGDGTTSLALRVAATSRHLLRHLVWGSVPGDVIEHHDSGRTRTLYPCEPRFDELVTAADLYPGDTVIASHGAPYSSVAEVTDVWRQPVRAAMHVHGTGVDGSPLRTQTGLQNRYVVLHSIHAEHAYASGGNVLLRSHA